MDEQKLTPGAAAINKAFQELREAAEAWARARKEETLTVQKLSAWGRLHNAMWSYREAQTAEALPGATWADVNSLRAEAGPRSGEGKPTQETAVERLGHAFAGMWKPFPRTRLLFEQWAAEREESLASAKESLSRIAVTTAARRLGDKATLSDNYPAQLKAAAKAVVEDILKAEGKPYPVIELFDTEPPPDPLTEMLKDMQVEDQRAYYDPVPMGDALREHLHAYWRTGDWAAAGRELGVTPETTWKRWQRFKAIVRKFEAESRQPRPD